METIIRTHEVLRALLPYVIGFVSGSMLLIVAVRVVFGSSAHRACLAWTVLPLGVLFLHAAAGSMTAYLAGYSGYALVLAVLAASHGLLALLFVRLARAIV